MQLARVVGRATATLKHRTLAGWRLLLVQPLAIDGSPDDFPQLVIDPLGASQGDDVIISSDGPSVREFVGAKDSPIRWAVLGIADRERAV